MDVHRKPSPRRQVSPHVTTWRWVAGAVAIASALAVVADRWYTNALTREVRADVRRETEPLSSSLQSAFERRVALLRGLQSFADAQPSRARLDEEFATFARGLSASLGGIRSLQFAEEGRVVAVWPLDGNERVLGLDLLTDRRPEMPQDVVRAMASAEPVLTGPVALLQGGQGLIVRGRITPRAGFPTLATVIIDVPSMIAAAGLPNRRSGLLLAVYDRSGSWVGGDTLPPGEQPVIAQVRVPDGDWALHSLPVEGWAARVAPRRRPVRAALGLAVLMVGAVGGLLGRRQEKLKSAVQVGSAQLGVALRAGRLGTWNLDIASNTLRFDENCARIFGRPLEELNRAPEAVFSFAHPDDVASVASAFYDFLSSGRDEYTLEHRIVLPDGSVRWVVVLGEIERDAQGQPTRAYGTLTDSSDRRMTEARARQLERVDSLGSVAGGIAHDFNNLIGAVNAFTEMARDGLDDAATPEGRAQARADLDEVLKVTSRAQGLVTQLLAFSKGTTSDPRRVDVGAAVQELSPMLQRLLGSRIALEVVVAPDVPAVWMDPSQLTQALLNLVVNARDAMHGRGRVEIRLARLDADDPRSSAGPNGTWVLLQVRDSGSGMTDDVRRRLFEPYFTTKGEGKGTGLGLPVVQSSVRSAGGHIDVESVVGEGSTFWIYLPPHTVA